MANKCQFRKKNGTLCDANAQAASGLCVFHDPARAADGRRVRRQGGLNRTRIAAVLTPATPDRALKNSNDVSVLLAESINQVRRGELEPRVANAVGYLSTVLLRALEQGPLEERMAKLEEALLQDQRIEPGNSTSNTNESCRSKEHTNGNA
jgi:hypothetical protein